MLLARLARLQLRAQPLAPALLAPASRGLAGKPKSDKPKSDKPKKGLSAYNFFVRDQVPIVRAEMPELEAKAVFKEVSVRYKVAKENPASMEKYIKAAAADKERATEELAAYQETHPE
jgi:hypothetical protein